jgi:hypothetical protein
MKRSRSHTALPSLAKRACVSVPDRGTAPVAFVHAWLAYDEETQVYAVFLPDSSVFTDVSATNAISHARVALAETMSEGYCRPLQEESAPPCDLAVPIFVAPDFGGLDRLRRDDDWLMRVVYQDLSMTARPGCEPAMRMSGTGG